MGQIKTDARTEGTITNVIVTPSSYGTDNRGTLDALKQMGKSARAVVVVDEGIKESETEKGNQLGIRGVRFIILKGGNLNLKRIRNIADKIAPFHWFLSYWMSTDTTTSIKGC